MDVPTLDAAYGLRPAVDRWHTEPSVLDADASSTDRGRSQQPGVIARTSRYRNARPAQVVERDIAGLISPAAAE
jgi:hypothetical protein